MSPHQKSIHEVVVVDADSIASQVRETLMREVR
jgi:hypothetical protein